MRLNHGITNHVNISRYQQFPAKASGHDEYLEQLACDLEEERALVSARLVHQKALKTPMKSRQKSPMSLIVPRK